MPTRLILLWPQTLPCLYLRILIGDHLILRLNHKGQHLLEVLDLLGAFLVLSFQILDLQCLTIVLNTRDFSAALVVNIHILRHLLARCVRTWLGLLSLKIIHYFSPLLLGLFSGCRRLGLRLRLLLPVGILVLGRIDHLDLLYRVGQVWVGLARSAGTRFLRRLLSLRRRRDGRGLRTLGQGRALRVWHRCLVTLALLLLALAGD